MTKLDKHTRVFLAVIILIPTLMVSLWIGTARYLESTETALGGALDRVLDGSGEVKELQTEWSKRHDLLVTFLNHDDINAVELNVVKFTTAVGQGDRELARQCAAEIKTLLEMIRSYDEINLKNIL